MKRNHLTALSAGLVLSAMFILSGCININQDVVVGDGETVSSGKSTVNGAIRVGENAEVRGALTTVNGSAQIGKSSRVSNVQTVNGRITLAAGAEAENLQTVNGRITLAEDVHVRGDAATINGAVTFGPGARVEGKISAINGELTLDNAEAGSLVNYNGDMTLRNGSIVHGEVRVRRPDNPDQTPTPTIIIGRDCRVLGEMVFEREVVLHVHETAEIGRVRGAEPITFTGDQP